MKSTYYKDKETVAEYIEMAKDVNGQTLIEKLKQFLPTGTSVLEIGSGPGTDWRILNNHYKVVGSDYSNVFLKHLKGQNPNGAFLKLDAVTLETNQTFDGIYSNKVLIHLNENELDASIKRQAAILNHGGIVCHSFWKGEGSEIFKGMFVQYYHTDTLITAFSNEFELLSIETYSEFEEDDSILLIGRKK